MNTDLPVTTRRAGIAAAAALLLASVSRPIAASGVEDDTLPPPCCGNGPPNTTRYGQGMQMNSVQPSGPDIEFDNPTGTRKLPAGTWYWVYVADLGVVVKSYTGPGGHGLKFYVNPRGFTGIVFAVEPGYTLVLTWPANDPPVWSTRAIANTEGTP